MDVVTPYEKAPSLKTLAPLVQHAIRHPQTTFDEMPLIGDLGPSLGLAMVLGAIMWAEEVYSMHGSLQSLLSNPQISQTLATPEGKRILDWVNPSGGWFALFLGGLPSVPVSFIFSVLSIHLALKVLGAAKGGWRATARVVAYTSTGAALVMVPLLGGLLSLGVVSVQLVAGLERVHETSTLKVLVALSAPVLLLFVVMLCVFGALMATHF